MSRIIEALNSTPGRLARVFLGLGIALGGPALFGAGSVCAFALAGVVPIYLGLKGRCLLESARGWPVGQASSRP
jgi:hypothetical protein